MKIQKHMKTLNNQEKQALKTYRQTGELGILSNILIEDCLEELKNNEESRNRFKSMPNLTRISVNLDTQNNLYFYNHRILNIVDLSNLQDKFLVIQTLLSRTPDGQAVMPFLDKTIYRESCLHLDGSTYNDLTEDFEPCYIKTKDKTQYKFLEIYTLDHLLYQEFTEVLRTAKTFDEALEIITKIYLTNIYV